jgi:hypothetical protein
LAILKLIISDKNQGAQVIHSRQLGIKSNSKERLNNLSSNTNNKNTLKSSILYSSIDTPAIGGLNSIDLTIDN